MNKQSKKVELCVILYAALENNSAYLLRTEITKSHLNNCICRHCSVKKSTVTPSFYYVFNISLSGNVNIPSFIGNLWWVLLLGIHLKTLTCGQLLFTTREKRRQHRTTKRKITCTCSESWDFIVKGKKTIHYKKGREKCVAIFLLWITLINNKVNVTGNHLSKKNNCYMLFPTITFSHDN